MMKSFEDISSYIRSCPEDRQDILREMRYIISRTAPEALETISYGMPTFKLNGNLVHFALAKKHLGFYPGPKAIAAFKVKLTTYKTSKGAIQLPLAEPLPVALIESIVLFNVKEQQKVQKPKSIVKL